MTRLFQRKGKLLIMDRRNPHEYDGKCAQCGKFEELRPYGPNNTSICFDCAMKDEAGTEARMDAMMRGAD